MKEWSKCSLQERKLIDCILRLDTIEEMIKRSGYAKTTITKKKGELKEAIAERMCMLDNQRVPKLEECIGQISDIAFGISREQFYDKEVGFRFKETTQADRLKAFNMLLKFHGAYIEKHEVKETQSISIKVVGDREDAE